MGIYTVMVTNGPHIAPIAGGYISQRLGWRWCFWIPGIIQAGLWGVLLLTFPETLFSRIDHSKLEKRSFTQKLLFHGKVLDRKVQARDFVTSLRMIQYAAVTLPATWYCTANTYGSALFAVTGSHLAAKVYHFDIEQTGLFMGIPLTVGCAIGEASAGWVSDTIINAYARRHNGYRKPEARLYLLPLCTFLAIGTSTYGYCVQFGKPWIQAAVCMAISGLGTQVGTTMVYTYCTDSYKPQSSEIGAVINLFKSGKSFTVLEDFRAHANTSIQSSLSTLASMLSRLGRESALMLRLPHSGLSTPPCSCRWSSLFSGVRGSGENRESLRHMKIYKFPQATIIQRRAFKSR